MNVLHLCDTPLSGAPYNLCRTLDKHPDINARLINHRDAYSPQSQMVYPSDICLSRGKNNKEIRAHLREVSEEVNEAFKFCDVIHCHNFLDTQKVFRFFPHAKEYLKTKPVVLQYHSFRGSIVGVENTLKDPRVNKHLTLAQYQARFFETCTIVPNALDPRDFTGMSQDSEKMVIGYAPSNINLTGWNNKGYNETVSVLKRLEKKHPKLIEVHIITNTPHLECMDIKSRCHVFIDEVMTGSYHMNSLEALAKGCVVINNIDLDCIKAMQSFTGDVEHPFVKSNIQDLSNVLESLLREFNDNPSAFEERMKKSLNFIKAHWSPEKIQEKFLPIYQEVIDGNS